MAQWRKVLVSGSAAHVSSVEVGTLDGTSGTIINNSSIAGSRITGSFTGSYTGDGSQLTGVTATGLDIDNFGSDLTSATLAVSDLQNQIENLDEEKKDLENLNEKTISEDSQKSVAADNNRFFFSIRNSLYSHFLELIICKLNMFSPRLVSTSLLLII